MRRLRRHSVRDRALAGLLLSGFLLLSAGPVCGSPTDVNAAACCKRHGCDVPQSKGGSANLIRSDEGRAGWSVAEVANSETAAEDCCRLASLTYPVVESQSSTSAFGVTLLVVTVQTGLGLATPVSSASTQMLHAPPLLKIPPIALYKLDSTYRI